VRSSNFIADIGIFLLVLFLLAVIGWVANVWQVIDLAINHVAISTYFIIKCVGLFLPPLGAIMGWIGLL
jgi:hypothetical protein